MRGPGWLWLRGSAGCRWPIGALVHGDDGGAATGTYQYVVVYDTEGGFVTGGGWVNSPAGAYVPDPTSAGKANFGFVSRYAQGAQVPEGETPDPLQR